MTTQAHATPADAETPFDRGFAQVWAAQEHLDMLRGIMEIVGSTSLPMCGDDLNELLDPVVRKLADSLTLLTQDSKERARQNRQNLGEKP